MGLPVCSFASVVLLSKILLLFHFVVANKSLTSMQPSCHDDERSSLLQFKHSFVIDVEASSSSTAYPKVLSWRSEGNRSNCCEWDGIQCDDKTSHVVGIDLSSSCLLGCINSNSSLFRLVWLQRLNLAYNYFNYSQIPNAIGQFSELTYLNLSSSVFSGQIPLEISGLSKLSSLDLSYNTDFNTGEKLLVLKHSNLRNLVQNLTRLENLKLSAVDISSQVPDLLTNFSSLTWLSLKDCGLYGQFPTKIFEMPNLEIINLSYNENLSGHLPTFNRSTALTQLNLRFSNFSGNLPSSIGNLRSLEALNLYNCRFSGPIPSSIGELSKLTSLDLSYNMYFSGQIPSSLQNLTQLQTISLSGNQISGHIPSWLRNFTQLVSFYINENQMNGSIPESFSKLMNLQDLSLHENSLGGSVKFDMLFNMKSLSFLELSFNRNLTLVFGEGNRNASLSKFKFLGLGTCNLSEFPNFIRHQRELEYLVLSGNKIQGKVPKWMWNTSTETFQLLAIDSNFLTGLDHPSIVLPFVDLRVLDLNSNLLQGPLPVPPPSTRHYDVSYNSLSGEIPPLICNLSSLKVMDLSNNKLSGSIPGCLGNFNDSLVVLKLGRNTFHGTIPVACAEASNLRMIDLSHNQFQQELPQSLATCTKLESLDLQNNQLTGVFPTWLGNLPELRVLILRKNKFHGTIGGSTEGLLFPKLHVLDLSSNNFIGNLSSTYMFIWNSMKSINFSDSTVMGAIEDVDFTGDYLNPYVLTYNYSITIVTKGVERSYPKILKVFAAIDLSSNKFNGAIPEAIGLHDGLQWLNLSNNMLTGSIPSSLGVLSTLESLDLSHNKLSGEIPPQLTKLHFLQSFDVAHNNLTGPIPQGNQLQTFDNSSFDGNPGLCGIPLSKLCDDHNSKASPPHSSIDDDDDAGSVIEFDWKFILAGFISGVVVGLSLGDIVFMKRQGWLVKILGRMPVRRGRNRRARRNNR